MRVTPEWLANYEAKRAAKTGQPIPPPDRSRAVEQEADLHDLIEEACLAEGWLYFHGRMDQATGRTPGEPDFVILMPGQVLLVEAKAKTGKLKPEQRDVIGHAAKLGHTVHVVRSIEEFWTAVNNEQRKAER